MSHITKIDIEVTDLEALKEAAATLGGELQEGKKSYRWFGTWVGDTQMPEGMTRADLGKCDHAIRFKGAEYELGVVKRKDGKGFTLAWDYWHSGGLDRVLGGQSAPKLKQAYGVARLKREARKRRMAVHEQRLQDGTIRLRVRGR